VAIDVRKMAGLESYVEILFRNKGKEYDDYENTKCLVIGYGGDSGSGRGGSDGM
jgi:hypothetical protein